MKKIIYFLLFLTNLLAFTEGKDYVKLDNDCTINNISVLWSSNSYDSYMFFKTNIIEELHKQFPNYNFELLIAQNWNQLDIQYIKLFIYAQYLDEKFNIQNTIKNSYYRKIMEIMFFEVFKNNNTNNKEYVINKGLKLLNASSKRIEDYFYSDEGQIIFSKLQNANNLSKIVGIPTFIINNCYVVNINNLKNINDFITIIQKINEID